MRLSVVARAATAAILLVALPGLAACGNEREAEAETANAQAEVTTSGNMSDAELNAAAVNAVLEADPNGAPFVTEGAGGTTSVTPPGAPGAEPAPK